MRKRLLLLILVFLLALPSLCLAADEAATLKKLGHCANIRSMAISYAADIKDLSTYKDKIDLQEYLEVKRQYQLVAAAFAELKSALELSIIEEKRLDPDIVNELLESIGPRIEKKYNTFSTTAAAILSRVKPGDRADYRQAPSEKGLSDAVTTSLISVLKDLYDKTQQAKKDKVAMLLTWLEKHYDCPNWEDIAAVKQPPPK